MEADESSQSLKYRTWVLKVYIHCEACKKKVKKVLQSVDGVFTTTVDSVQQKVTVTGDVDADTLIRKLQKTGKYVELWPEKGGESAKGSGKDGDASGKNGKAPAEKNNENGGKKSGGGNQAKDGAAKEAAGEKPGGGDAKKQGTDEKPAGEAPSPDGVKGKEGNGGGGGGGGGKKKGKKGNGNGNGGGGGSGGENSGDGSAGNAGDGGGQPPAGVGAAAVVAQVGGATVAPPSYLQMLHQYPALVPPVCGGWGGQLTPAVNYSTATPVVSYGGFYAPPSYVDASFMVPYGSGGVVRYVPPGSYMRRQDDYDMYNEENSSVCSVM